MSSPESELRFREMDRRLSDMFKRIDKMESEGVDNRLFEERTRNLSSAVERVEKRQEATSNLLRTAIVAILVNLLVSVVGGVLLSVLSH